MRASCQGFAVALFSAALSWSAFVQADEPPTFLISSGKLEPASTFEVRFPDEVVPASAVGGEKPVPASFEPGLQGEWRWSSRRSAIFTPAEPMALDARYRVTIPSRKTVEGRTKAIAASFKTPPFQVEVIHPSPSSTDSLAPVPRLQLLLNARIDPQRWDGKLFFNANNGARIPAQVQPARTNEYFPRNRGPGGQLEPWSDRFHLARGEEAPWASGSYRIAVQPVTPLPVGSSWELQMPAGLPATNGLETKAESWEIGSVRPFTLKVIEAESEFGSGRQINIRFTKSISNNGLEPKDYQEQVAVSPEVENLAVYRTYNGLWVRGDFQPQTDYTIQLPETLRASDGTPYSGETRLEVRMPKMEPRLALTDFDAPQLAGGRRGLELLSVNNGKVRVQAKRLTADQLATALTTYGDRHLQRPNSDEYDGEGRVDFSALPGELVYDETLDLSAPVDELVVKKFDIDQFLDGAQTGTFAFQVETVGQEPLVGVQTINQVTDLGVVWKRGTTQWLAFVHSLATGAPLTGVTVKLVTPEGKALASGTTQADGTVTLARPDNGTWMLLQTGDDQLATRIDEERNPVSRYPFRVSMRYDDPADDDYSIFLFTDRGVYQPGDPLHLRGVVREWKEGLLTLPLVGQATVSIYNPQGRIVRTEELALDADGSFVTEFVLPESPNGYYRARVVVTDPSQEEEDLFKDEDDQPSGSVTFQMQDYEPAAFEVALTADLPPAGADEMAIHIGATYQTGEPLAGAVAHWNADLRTDYNEASLPGYHFGVSAYEAKNYLQLPPPALSRDGEAILDQTGEITFHLPIQGMRDHITPLRLFVTAEVISDSQQTITTESYFGLNQREEAIGIKQPEEQAVAGDPASFTVVLTDSSGTPIDRTLAGDWRCLRIHHNSIREETAGGGHRYRQQITTEQVADGRFDTVEMRQNFGQWLPASDAESMAVTLKEPGDYYIVFQGTDSAGSTIASGIRFDVAGEGEESPGWKQPAPYVIELSPERPDYLVDDTARILVKSPILGHALVTVERENVQRYFVTEFTEETPVVEVALDEADTPNTFVSVTIIRGADQSPDAWPVPEYRIGYTDLLVRDPERELKTAIGLSQQEYEPRQMVETTVQVSDVDGNPVPDANITLYAVDEGVLALTNYQTPNPIRFFYRLRSLFVQTGLTIRELREENPDALAYWNKGYVIGGGGMMMDPTQLRTNFAAVAHWSTDLRTGRDGKAIASFIAPDSLTKYRVMAVVQEGATKFGSAETSFQVRKPFMIKPSLPRLTRVGDRLNARALLQNTLEEAGAAEVRLQVEGPAEIDGDAIRSGIEVEANGAATVDFPVVITGVGEVTWTWEATLATGNGEIVQDGMREASQSRRVTPLVRTIKNPALPATAASMLASIDPTLLESSNIDVQVALSNSRLIELREGVERLLVYPYGCLEQTTSSTLPWLVIGPLREVIPEMEVDDDTIQKSVIKGLAKLWGMQTRDGGLAYWPGGQDSMLWGSAYAGLVIAMAHEAGWQPDTNELERFIEYLRTGLRHSGETADKKTLAAQAMAAYALALFGQPEPAYHEVLFQKRTNLGPESRRFLALAILTAEGPAEMARTLIEEPIAADWQRVWFGSLSRLRALDLLCRIQLETDEERVEDSYDQLMALRQNGGWQTTQGNAWALLAALAYDERQQSDHGRATARLSWEGESEEVTVPGPGPNSIMRSFQGNDLKPESLTAEQTGERKVYSELRLTAEVDTPAQTLAKNDGFSVARSYTRLAPDGTIAEDQRLVAGDRVLVTLTVTTSEDSEYVALEDPLPALLEAVNPSFTTQRAGAWSQVRQPGQAYDSFRSFRELKEDAALFFADWLPAGRHVVRYVARVRHTGRATAPATQVERMYDPEFRGRSAPMVISANIPAR